MPTRKIADLDPVCRHPNHEPPGHMVYESGVWEHECPGCGRKYQFVVNKPTCIASDQWTPSQNF